MVERYANKRLMHRKGGRFAKAPTLAEMGYDVADGPRQCSCGHVWHPIVKTGRCPKCQAQDSVALTPAPQEGQPLRLVAPRFVDPRWFRWSWPKPAVVQEDGIKVLVEGISDAFHLPYALEPGTKLSVRLLQFFEAEIVPKAQE